eukprot:TRINITY_DN14315_c0_g2_i1.p1 TRINITY_DN14315_c0_g2~~TRINITY_DN14315_c0_g2_i1.p1  ORF type:complete len:416 (-),score=13.17 TRINITY_DN14315_c0_g2_i1:174-1421(-)
MLAAYPPVHGASYGAPSPPGGAFGYPVSRSMNLPVAGAIQSPAGVHRMVSMAAGPQGLPMRTAGSMYLPPASAMGISHASPQAPGPLGVAPGSVMNVSHVSPRVPASPGMVSGVPVVPYSMQQVQDPVPSAGVPPHVLSARHPHASSPLLPTRMVSVPANVLPAAHALSPQMPARRISLQGEELMQQPAEIIYHGSNGKDDTIQNGRDKASESEPLEGLKESAGRPSVQFSPDALVERDHPMALLEGRPRTDTQHIREEPSSYAQVVERTSRRRVSLLAQPRGYQMSEAKTEFNPAFVSGTSGTIYSVSKHQASPIEGSVHFGPVQFENPNVEKAARARSDTQIVRYEPSQYPQAVRGGRRRISLLATPRAYSMSQKVLSRPMPPFSAGIAGGIYRQGPSVTKAPAPVSRKPLTA